MRALAPREAVIHFRDFLDKHREIFVQAGVKEIQHQGFECVSRAFPSMKVVVTARDRRDIFLSQHHRKENLAKRGRPWADPEALAENINEEFQRIQEIMARHEHLVVKYEEVASSPEVLQHIRQFTESDTTEHALLGKTAKGIEAKHGSDIRQTRIGLWKQEADPDGIRGSKRAFELMRGYAEFFGYKPIE